ncbi:MAG: prephenate dehydratase [Balneolaceae bacterium]
MSSKKSPSGKKPHQSPNVEEYREKIDDLDRKLIQTLAKRHRIVRELFSDKLKGAGRIRDEEREGELLRRIRQLAAEEGIDPYFAEKIFHDIIQQSLRYQTYSLVDHQNENGNGDRVRVSYQGVQGAFSNQAATRHFSERYKEVECIGYKTFDQAAKAVEEEAVDYAILPIENTTAGSINDTYDLLAGKNLHIVGEEVLHIVHCLMAPGNVKLENIRRILSHPQAIAQCSHFLSELPRCRVESYYDTAMAARKVRDDNDLSQAAIASTYAAELYDLHIVKKNIANQPENYTRFVIVSREPVSVDSQIQSKTSIVFATPHEKGALLRCLNALEKHDINMTKLESRPRPRKPWQYQFFLDVEGNSQDPRVQKGLKELESKSVYMKILGSYPRQSGE